MNRIRTWLAVVGFCIPGVAQAVMTVTPESPWGADNGTVYYVAGSYSGGGSFSGNGAAHNAVFLDTASGYREINLTLGVNGGALERDLIKLTVKTDQTIALTGSQQPVVAVVMKDASNAERFVPIAWAGGSVCSGGNCQGQSTIGGQNYYLSAKFYSQGTLQIGLYPHDLCTAYFVQQGTSAAGCNSGDVIPTKTTVSGTASRLALSIRVYTAIDSGSATQPGLADTTADTAALNLNFQADGPSITTCPDMNSIYFPGDGEIFVFPASYSIIVHDGATPGSEIASTNRAPISALVTVAKKGQGIDPNVTSAFRSNSNLVSIQPLSALSSVSGFENGSFYGVGFMFRDAAGLIASNDTCVLQDVKTSEIQGFLKESKCFIATAAFRSQESAPVRLLRIFRNQKLKPHAWGRAFVSLYEEVSPPLAQWVVDHPESRFFVLAALTPIEGLAWFALQPGSGFLLKALLFIAAAILMTAARVRLRNPRGGSPS